MGNEGRGGEGGDAPQRQLLDPPLWAKLTRKKGPRMVRKKKGKPERRACWHNDMYMKWQVINICTEFNR